MAAIRLKGFIIFGVLAIVFLFLLNTFILNIDQERYLNVESKEIREVLEQRREYFNTETEAETKYKDDSNKQEVKHGVKNKADILSFSNRQPRKASIQSLSSDESCEDKHISKQEAMNEKLIGAIESLAKPDQYKGGLVSKARDHITTALNQPPDKVVGRVETKKNVTTKMSRSRRRKQKETKEEKERKEKDGYGKHAFNQSASDLIPLNRSIPDTRGGRYGC